MPPQGILIFMIYEFVYWEQFKVTAECTKPNELKSL